MRCADCQFSKATGAKTVKEKRPRGFLGHLFYDPPLEHSRVAAGNAYVGMFWCKLMPEKVLKAPDDWCGQFKNR